MDESDEDIDPLVGPVADLMAEHNLSSTTTTNVKKPVESMVIVEQKINLFEYLSFLNIRFLFQNLWNYILDYQWYCYLSQFSPKIEQEISFNRSSLKKLFFIFIVSIPFFVIHFHLFLFQDLRNSYLDIFIRRPSFTHSLHLISSHR